jgi:hypothetical protein
MSEGQGAQSPTRQKFRKIRSLLTSTGFSEEHLVMGAAFSDPGPDPLRLRRLRDESEVWRGTLAARIRVGLALEIRSLVVVGKTNSSEPRYDGWLLATDSKGGRSGTGRSVAQETTRGGDRRRDDVGTPSPVDRILRSRRSRSGW